MLAHPSALLVRARDCLGNHEGVFDVGATAMFERAAGVLVTSARRKPLALRLYVSETVAPGTPPGGSQGPHGEVPRVFFLRFRTARSDVVHLQKINVYEDPYSAENYPWEVEARTWNQFQA